MTDSTERWLVRIICMGIAAYCLGGLTALGVVAGITAVLNHPWKWPR